MKKRSTAAFAGICGLKTAVLAVIVLCLIVEAVSVKVSGRKA